MSGELDRRLAALADAVEIADGRLSSGEVEAARTVIARAGKRLGFGLEATVVALAGPTGAGKSTLFNALAGAELAAAGRRRPTTSAAAAAMWGDAGGALLDWLDVPRRHQTGDGALEGLVLLDLPDFDSVEQGHRLEVDRLIELVDLVVWVVDPQKYADAAWHERYQRHLAAYSDSMLVALNQADLLDADALAACRADVARLLRDDGLEDIPVLVISARTGDGVPALKRALEERVRAREAALARLAADVTTAAASLGGECGERSRDRVRGEGRDRLLTALSGAAGVPVVVRAVTAAQRRRGALATGWPFIRWLRRLRPDPLRRLGLGARLGPATRSSLPGPSPVQRAQVAAASRALAVDAAGDLAEPWPGLVRSAATSREDQVADRLERAVAGADLHMREPFWWRVVGLVQWLLAAAVVVGGVWLLVLAILGYLHVEEVVPLPEIRSVPVPTLMIVGGALGGLLVSFLSGVANAFGARRRGRKAERELREQVETVGEDLVIQPVERELEAYNKLCESLETAAGGGRGWLPWKRRAERKASAPAHV